ncbi:hypothetical protein AVEN_160929-1 [Araneus ventricosus]|uniref:Uncharacterized protein n=1 Tax=Araneus ventricosus TaxID=182803 RepID=A0A4Y2BEC5_ARAVE|nr:hypothetical protein AVEN_160929-1 [Araneus ventricosus]
MFVIDIPEFPFENPYDSFAAARQRAQKYDNNRNSTTAWISNVHHPNCGRGTWISHGTSDAFLSSFMSKSTSKKFQLCVSDV